MAIEARSAAAARAGAQAVTPPASAAHGPPEGVYIKQAAELVGVTPTVIRAWEQHRLVTPHRTASGYRIYTVENIKRLHRIRELIHHDRLNAAGVRRELGEDGPHPNGTPELSPTMGRRLRALRHRRGLSLRQLGAETGLSASYISELERSMATPSVASLQKLAAALGTNMVRLLNDDDASAERVVITERDQRNLPLEIPGVAIFALAAVETQLEPLLFHVEPGAGSAESYSHEGEEFLYVLQGALEVTLDETATYRLQPRDSMTFASHRPHRWWNHGAAEALVLWVNTPPTF